MRSCVTFHAVASGCEKPDFECNMTLSDVRRLAPTYCFLAYKEDARENPGAARSDDVFFENLAAAMHTSKAMLLSRYIVSGHAVAPGHLAGATMLAGAAVEATKSALQPENVRTSAVADRAAEEAGARKRAAQLRLAELQKEQEELRALVHGSL